MQKDKVNLVKNVSDFSASCGQGLMLPFSFLIYLNVCQKYVMCSESGYFKTETMFPCSIFYIFSVSSDLFSQRATFLIHAVSVGIFHFERIDRLSALVKEMKFMGDLDFSGSKLKLGSRHSFLKWFYSSFCASCYKTMPCCITT